MIRLYEYQAKALAKLPANCIMAWDTGTGKTVSSLAHYEQYNVGLPLLILAPASKVRTKDWEREATEFGLSLDNITVISYEKATRVKSIERQILGKERRFWWQDYMTENPEYMLIADEVHKAKNPQSLTGKGVFALATGAQQFMGLSATPLPNGWVDACNYGKIFGWWKNKTEFYRDYVITYQIPNQHWSKITGYRHEDKLKQLWAGVAKPLLKKDALDLPKFRYQAIHIPKPKIYDQVRKTRIYRAEELDNAPKLANGLRRTLIDRRVQWLADFLDGASGHTVIFYNYIEEREAVLNIVPKDMTIYRQDGQRHEVPNKSEWNNLPERSVTIMQYKSGSVGIECTYADKMVYLGETYSYAEFAQSIGRVYRNGQKLPVTAYLLHTRDTISEQIWACIRRKKSFDIELWKQEEDK